MLQTLSSSIDPANIPEQFGGKLSFQHGSIPQLDDGISNALNWIMQPKGTLPAGPIKWVLDEQGKRMAVAVGRVDGVPRYQPIATLDT